MMAEDFDADLLGEISGAVTDAVNQENLDALEDDISDILNDAEMAAEDREAALQAAYVTFVTASQAGCLPDYMAAFAMDVDPGDIREEIQGRIDGALDPGDDGELGEWRETIDGLDMGGDSIISPDGWIIEVYRLSCREILENNKSL